MDSVNKRFCERNGKPVFNVSFLIDKSVDDMQEFDCRCQNYLEGVKYCKYILEKQSFSVESEKPKDPGDSNKWRENCQVPQGFAAD